MSLISFIIFGLIVGAIAKFLMPGKDPGGWLMTIILGIAGSFVGGMIGNLLGGNSADVGSTAGWIGSILGAMLLLFLYRMYAGRRTV